MQVLPLRLLEPVPTPLTSARSVSRLPRRRSAWSRPSPTLSRPTVSASAAHSWRETDTPQGFTGLYDGLTGTLLRQMTYSMMRFAAYDQIKASMHPGPGPAPAWKMALAGSLAGGIAGVLGNPAELMMVRMQADKREYIVQDWVHG